MRKKHRSDQTERLDALIATEGPAASDHWAAATTLLADSLGEDHVHLAGQATSIHPPKGSQSVLFAITDDGLHFVDKSGAEPADAFSLPKLELEVLADRVRVSRSSATSWDLVSSIASDIGRAMVNGGATSVSGLVPSWTLTSRGLLSNPLHADVRGRVLGGNGDWGHISAGAEVCLAFRADYVQIKSAQDEPLATVRYADAGVLEISGAGRRESGGGFAGGGIGLEGVVVGMAVAGALNAVTSSVTVETIIRLTCDEREIFVQHSIHEPQVLRIELSPAVMAINHRPGVRNV